MADVSAVDVGDLAAGHDRQRPVLRPRRRAGDRRVDEAVALLFEGLADPPRVGGGDRRHVDEQRARPRTRGGPGLRVEQDRVDLRAVDDHRDDDVGLGRRVPRRRDGLYGALLLRRPRLRLPLRPRPRGHLEPVLHQVRGHPRPHDPQPQEADARHGGQPSGRGREDRSPLAARRRRARRAGRALASRRAMRAGRAVRRFVARRVAAVRRPRWRGPRRGWRGRGGGRRRRLRCGSGRRAWRGCGRRGRRRSSRP